jgi:hypothetical protein
MGVVSPRKRLLVVKRGANAYGDGGTSRRGLRRGKAGRRAKGSTERVSTRGWSEICHIASATGGLENCSGIWDMGRKTGAVAAALHGRVPTSARRSPEACNMCVSGCLWGQLRPTRSGGQAGAVQVRKGDGR